MAEVLETPTKSTPSRRSAPVPLGTRVSRRLRDVDDEWQQVPEEWLSPEKNDGESTMGRAKGRANVKNKAKDDDDESELSELTDEEEHQRAVEASKAGEVEEEANGHASDGALTPVSRIVWVVRH